MKASFPLCLLVQAILPAGLFAQEIILQNGSRFPINNPTRKGEILFIDVLAPGATSAMQMGKKMSEIKMAEMPPNPAVAAARSLLYAGKLAESATAIKPVFDSLSPLCGIPGAGWEDAALLYAAALQASGRVKEAVPILEQIVASYPKTLPAVQIATIRLCGLKNVQSPQEVVRVADELIASKPGAEVVAESNLAAGDALLANRNYEQSLNRHLKVVVFSPTDRWLAARSLLGAAKAMASLNEKKNCVRTLGEIISSYPGTPQAEAAAKLLSDGGKTYADLAVEIQNDEADAKKRLIEASAGSRSSSGSQ
jgi:tetratricopeptide (TPR) repeat protein